MIYLHFAFNTLIILFSEQVCSSDSQLCCGISAKVQAIGELANQSHDPYTVII